MWRVGVSPPLGSTPGAAFGDTKKPPSPSLLSLRPQRHRAHLSNASAWIGAPRPTRTGPTSLVNRRGTARRLREYPAVLRRASI